MTISVFFSVMDDIWSILLSYYFFRQNYLALFWMLLCAWKQNNFFICSEEDLINDIIFAFSRMFLLNSLNYSSYVYISMILWIILITAESKVSPFIMKVEVWINWIPLRSIEINWGNLIPCPSTSRVSSNLLNLVSQL